MARPPILTLSDVTLSFGGNPLFKDLDLVVHPGARACLVGRNGSGKSTLMKVIAGMIVADQGNRFLTPGLSVGYMQQDPTFEGFATLRDFAVSEMDPSEVYKVDMAAEGLKLNLDATPETASGGERRRAALAKIIAEAPDLMLLDEPTNHLDIEAIAWLEDHLKKARSAYIVISHDRAFLRNLTNAIIWVDRGQTRQHPKGFEAFENWQEKMFAEEDEQRHKLNRLIKAEARWAVEGISARRKRNQGRVRRLQDLRSEKSSQIARQGAAKMALDGGPKSGKLVVEAKNITQAFGDKKIVTDFSIKVMRGECIGFIGPNGVGKTTLLNILTDKLAPQEGTIRFGTNLIPAIFDQNRAALDPNESLWDSLANDQSLGVAGANDQIMVRGAPKHVVGYLKEFLFDENQARSPVSALSGGEKARLLLARIMARESNLLILDEPTNDLDVETLDLLQELLSDYDGTVLLVSHDRDFLDRVVTTTIAMEGDGRATAYAGGYTDYLAQRSVVKTQTSSPKKSSGSETSKEKIDATPNGLSFTEQHRLKDLPQKIERLEAEIAKLEEYLMDPNLFTDEPVKFAKASDALVERHAMLSDFEEEWLGLEERANADG